MRKLLRVAVVCTVVVGLMAVGPAAFAAGNKPFTITEHERGFTDTFTEVFCVGGDLVDASISIVENGVFHGTFFEDELLHVTGTFVGKFVADPVDPSLPTFTGRYTVWFGENQNSNIDNTTFTFSATGTGSDGSKVSWHDVGHITAESIIFDEDTHTEILEGVRTQFFKTTC